MVFFGALVPTQRSKPRRVVHASVDRTDIWILQASRLPRKQPTERAVWETKNAFDAWDATVLDRVRKGCEEKESNVPPPLPARQAQEEGEGDRAEMTRASLGGIVVPIMP